MGKRDSRNSPKMKRRRSHSAKIARDKRKTEQARRPPVAAKPVRKAPVKKEKPAAAPHPPVAEAPAVEPVADPERH